MPYKKKKVDGYKVTSPHGVKAKATTEEKAEAQMRLLRAIEHDPTFKPRKKKRHSAEDGKFLEDRKKKFGVTQ